MDRPQTLIVSDLHLGGGAADRGDDHVHQQGQLERFIRQELRSRLAQCGGVELFFNGDFFEFVQVEAQAYRARSSEYWCSEPESLVKLEAILAGHANIFAALRDFQARGNLVTIAAGNHDVDLCWPAVQQRLRETVGAGIRFVTGVDWVARYAGRLQIAHGHHDDPANRFVFWSDPVRDAPDGRRLEMCPGTLFMVRFVNALEARYPFADNLHPVQNLAGLLLRDDAAGLASASWMLLKFAARHGKSASGGQGDSDIGRRLLERLLVDDDFAQRLAVACRVLAVDWTRERLRSEVGGSEAQLAELMMRLLAVLPADEWQQLFTLPPAVATPKTLGTIIGARNFGKDALRQVAQRRFAECSPAQVVVMGHTHLPDEQEFAGGCYLNPGAWTRYLDLEQNPNLTLADLRDESRFPYQLNCVRVEASGQAERLSARLECFERSG